MSKYPDQPPPYGFQQGAQPGYQPPQPGYQPPQPGFPVQVIQQQPQMVVVGNPAVGPNSQPMTCPSCHHQISSRVESESTTKTHIIAILLCVFCCWPCICVPYCMDSCKNLNHYCPKCNTFLGTYSN